MALLLAFFGTLLIISGCDSDQSVARVGEMSITKNELLRDFEKNLGRKSSYVEVPYSRKEELLNGLIEKKRKVLAARERGLDQDSSFLAEQKTYRERMIGSRYYEKFVMDQLISKEELDTYIQNQADEVNADHIMISFKDVNARNQRTRDEALALAATILEKLKNGADFNLMADEYSDEPGVKKSHGVLGWFTWGTMADPFQKAVWEMKPGEISDVVETRFGFHIIRLNERRTRPGYVRPDTEEQVYNIKRTLSKAYMDSARTLWEKQREMLEKKYDLKLIKENIIKMSTLVTERMNSGSLHTSTFSDMEKQNKLAEWNGGEITVGTLLEGSRNNVMRMLINYKQASFLENDVRNKGTVELVMTDAHKTGIDQDPFIEEMLTRFSEDKLVQMVDRSLIEEPATVTDEEAEEFYRQHPDDFMRPEEIELWEIYVKKKTQAEDIVAQLKRGTNFGTLVKKYSQDKMAAGRDGYVGYRAVGSRGPVSREAFALGPGGKIGGPIEYRNGWVVFKTGNLRESSVREFKDVKNRAKSLLRRERIRENSVRWKNELIENYPAEIDRELVESL